MNIIFLGAPGSGKGTQAAMLSKSKNIAHISTGELLRYEVANNTSLGIKVKSYLDSGDLVPDELVVDLIKFKISKKDCANGFILDGFPRNISQAQMLAEMMNLLGKKIDLVVNFEIDEEILIKRVSGRFSCKSCGEVYNKFYKNTKINNVCDNCEGVEFLFRSDDNTDTLKSRLKIYNEFSFDLIKFYKKNNLLISIDALESASLIFDNLVKSILSVK